MPDVEHVYDPGGNLTMIVGLASVLVGVLLWVLAFINHEVGSGELRMADRFRRLVRLGDGPARTSSVAVELLAAAFVIFGIAIAAGWMSAESALLAGGVSAALVLLLDVAIQVRDRRRPSE